MNKQLCLIALAFAAHQSYTHQKSETGNPTTDLYERHMRKNPTQNTNPQSKAPTVTSPSTATPQLIITGCASKNPEYCAQVQATIQEMINQSKKGSSVDITQIQQTVLTEYAPEIVRAAQAEQDRKHETRIRGLETEKRQLEEAIAAQPAPAQSFFTRRNGVIVVLSAFVGYLIGSSGK